MSSRSKRAKQEFSGLDSDDYGVTTFDTPKPRRAAPLVAITEAQKDYIKAINGANIVFGLGPAGTGKTYIATAMAADSLKAKKIERLILTRPAVEAGESLGFLPGNLNEKYEPYLRPVREVLLERLGQGFVECAVKNGKIEPIPLAYMRGATFKNAIIILDEAQNTTPLQMKMFLTRLGEGSTMIINGDPSQKDIPGPSGLVDAVNKIACLSGVRVVEFGREDIVRHGLVQDIVEQYESPSEDMEGVRRTIALRR